MLLIFADFSMGETKEGERGLGSVYQTRLWDKSRAIWLA